jgi:hypothetical protein
MAFFSIEWAETHDTTLVPLRRSSVCVCVLVASRLVKPGKSAMRRVFPAGKTLPTTETDFPLDGRTLSRE